MMKKTTLLIAVILAAQLVAAGPCDGSEYSQDNGGLTVKIEKAPMIRYYLKQESFDPVTNELTMSVNDLLPGSRKSVGCY